MPRIEKAKWIPPDRGISDRRSATRKALDSMVPGDCIRIVHDDLKCGVYGACSLSAMVSTKRREHGWGIELYHEEPHIAVVRRRQ